VAVPLKYAIVERERRFLVDHVPDGIVRTRRIVDRYVDGTRLRLREVTEDDGEVTRKLGHKVRLTDGPEEVASTSMYLDDAEWELLSQLPAHELRKTRYVVVRDGLTIAVDEFEDGALLAEIDDGDNPPREIPTWLAIQREVTSDEEWTGARRARQVARHEYPFPRALPAQAERVSRDRRW
jgi:CYTH domain-containing protein